MSVILLSLLLIILVGLGGLMARKTSEYFDNPPASGPMLEVDVVEMSPALANLLETPNLVAQMNGTPPAQVDPLKREQEVIAAASKSKSDADDSDSDEVPKQNKRSRKSKCPKCPKCPDMSQYVRLDEVPCWNCTLP